jgi:hypothetical protein
MEPRNRKPSEHKAPEPRALKKPGRFRLVKLEERIAPSTGSDMLTRPGVAQGGAVLTC